MKQRPIVAVIGAGPAGIFAAKQLAGAGACVALFNRDIKPGGLAEYGIFFDKFKMKGGLRKQFRDVLNTPEIAYFGNVTVGENGDVTLQQLRQLGFDAILVTVGAQGTKWLGLPGEELHGVYHAKDLVYHYNKLPPFSEHPYAMGRRVAIIGAGNVMIDIANWVIRYLHADEVICVVRRDPSAVKFTKKEMQIVIANLDLEALDAEIARTRAVMEAVGIDVAAAHDFILSALARAEPPVSTTRFTFEFLATPQRIIDDGSGSVGGLEVEDTTLAAREGGGTRAIGLGSRRVLDVDTVVFAIGDKVEDGFGLPVVRNEFAKHPEPCYPVDGVSYEAYDPEGKEALDGVFVAGWAREASSGLVGTARKDGMSGARALLQYLAARTPADHLTINGVRDYLGSRQIAFVDKQRWQLLDRAELQVASEQGVAEYRYGSNREMLARMQL